MEEKYSCNLILPGFTGILPVEGSCCSDNNVAGDAPADQDDREASGPAAKRVQPKRKCMGSDSCIGEEDDAETDVPENLKTRKPGASGDRGEKNVPPKKKQKLAKLSGDEGEEGNNNIAGQDGRSSCTCCSEEDGVCQELDNDKWAQNSDESSALDRDGKATTRASRGAATDAQSLYARRRRQRINERLRILHSLIPNGTKVDISTMLEEAVRYVKFLQLQIKLLSSDELWMYAPIAYNGMDVGLNQILPSQLL